MPTTYAVIALAMKAKPNCVQVHQVSFGWIVCWDLSPYLFTPVICIAIVYVRLGCYGCNTSMQKRESAKEIMAMCVIAASLGLKRALSSHTAPCSLRSTCDPACRRGLVRCGDDGSGSHEIERGRKLAIRSAVHYFAWARLTPGFGSAVLP